MRNRLCLAFVGIPFFCTLALSAQQPQAAEDRVFDRIESMVRGNAEDADMKSKAYSDAIENELPTTIALYRVTQQGEIASSNILAALQEIRTDQQVGAGSSTSGSTSLVVKGGGPSILGLAVENGGLNRTIDGTTITFRGSPIGLMKALEGRDLLQIHSDLKNDPTLMALAKLSFAFSFDTNRGDTPGVFSADKQQLSAYSFRYELINRRDPRDRRYDSAWRRMLIPLAEEFADVTGKLRTMLSDKTYYPELVAWNDGLKNICKDFDILGASESNLKKFRSNLKLQLDKLDNLPATEKRDLDSLLDNIEYKLSQLIVARDEIRQMALQGALVTFEFTNTRDPILPDLYNLRLIAQTRIGSRADFTGNFSASFFRTGQRLPENSSQWRDIHLAGQLDIPLGDVRKVGNFVLSFAGRWEYLPNDTRTPLTFDLLASDTIFDDGSPILTDDDGRPITEKGHIGIFQAKLTIPLKGSGIKIPISFSASNRTEFIREKNVGVNIGVTFNLDSFFAK